jgi:phosphatidylglycerol:prolipoprotein diacylglycerol transferase
MHPILIEFGDFSLKVYGLMAALGLLSGIWLASREAERTGEDKERVMDIAFYMVLAAILGARLMYVILEWDYFAGRPLDAFKIWQGGLVFYGGFIGAVVAGAIYVRRHAMPFWKTADFFAIGIPFGHALGRIGCFAAGCCYGLATDLPWAVKFTDPNSLAPLHVHLHPTQLYSAAGNFAIFGIVYMMRKKKTFDGQLALTYIALYAVMRSIMEFFRGDDRGAIFFGIISPAQITAMVMVVLAIAGMFYLSRQKGEGK